MNADFMRLERHERGIQAIEEGAGPGSWLLFGRR